MVARQAFQFFFGILLMAIAGWILRDELHIFGAVLLMIWAGNIGQNLDRIKK